MPLELEPEPLLPHPAASTPTAASATSATSGRRSSPDLLGGVLLVPFLTRMCVSSFAGLGPCLVVHQLLWSPCRADLPPTMTSRRPGVVVASPQLHHPAASIPAYPLAAMDAGRRRPVQAAARSRGVPSTLRVTWMLPRVALAYGQRRSARAISSAASADERCGACRSRATCRPKPPCPVGPIPTRVVILVSLASSLWPWATASSEDWKQAPKPTANSCSGLVPGPPGPPMSSGTESWRSRRPSEVRPTPARPPCTVASAV